MTSADDDDPFLDALAELARAERTPPDPRLEALAAGALSADDEAALRAEAADDPALAAAVALYAPLGDESRDRFTAAARAAFEAGDGGSEAPLFAELDDFESLEAGTADPPRPADTVPDNVLRFPRRRWIAPVVALAAAAAIALVVWRPGEPALPRYAVEMSGGVVDLRGDEVRETLRFGPGDRFELRLRPDAPIEGPIEVRAAVLVDGALRPWPVEPATSAEGAVRIMGTGASLGLTAFGFGERVVRVVVGRAGALPPLRAEMPRHGEGWWRFDVPIVLTE